MNVTHTVFIVKTSEVPGAGCYNTGAYQLQMIPFAGLR